MTALTDRRPDPVQPADDAARSLARDLLGAARHAALSFTDPDTGTPGISRIAFGLDPDGCPLTLVSGLALHRRALETHPQAAVMVGEPGEKGDPLTHPRLMLRVAAEPVSRDAPEHLTLRQKWLADHPKAQLYIDFPDFIFVRLRPIAALLNGGFASAYRLVPADLM